MSTRSWHYAKAEGYLAEVESFMNDIKSYEWPIPARVEAISLTMQRAQVHAILASVEKTVAVSSEQHTIKPAGIA